MFPDWLRSTTLTPHKARIQGSRGGPRYVQQRGPMVRYSIMQYSIYARPGLLYCGSDCMGRGGRRRGKPAGGGNLRGVVGNIIDGNLNLVKYILSRNIEILAAAHRARAPNQILINNDFVFPPVKTPALPRSVSPKSPYEATEVCLKVIKTCRTAVKTLVGVTKIVRTECSSHQSINQCTQITVNIPSNNSDKIKQSSYMRYASTYRIFFLLVIKLMPMSAA